MECLPLLVIEVLKLVLPEEGVAAHFASIVQGSYSVMFALTVATAVLLDAMRRHHNFDSLISSGAEAQFNLTSFHRAVGAILVEV